MKGKQVKGLVGRTVALTGCLSEAYNGTVDGKGEYLMCSILGGLFVVEEFHPYEPSNYVFSPAYTVVPADEPERGEFWIAAQDLEEQVDPAGHARMLVLEREMAFAEEESWV